VFWDSVVFRRSEAFIPVGSTEVLVIQIEFHTAGGAKMLPMHVWSDKAIISKLCREGREKPKPSVRICTVQIIKYPKIHTVNFVGCVHTLLWSQIKAVAWIFHYAVFK
jgi:hypothetical protein